MWSIEENPQGYAVNLHWTGGFWIHVENGPGLIMQHILEDPAIVIQFANYAKSGDSAIISNRIIFGEESIEFFVNSTPKLAIKSDGIYLAESKHPIRVDQNGFLRINKK